MLTKILNKIDFFEQKLDRFDSRFESLETRFDQMIDKKENF